MYAIVDIAGQQFKVEKKQKLFVHRMNEKTGSKVTFDKVLLIENEGKITVGNPLINNAAVSATVIEHVKGDKVLVFKKKRRKGYQKLNGHRQYLTQVEITNISEKAAVKSETKAEAEEKPEATKTASRKKPAAKKPAGEKKAAAPAEKKTGTTKSASKTSATKATTTKAAPKSKPAAASKASATKKPAAAKKPAAKKPAEKKTDSKAGDADKK
ncbi:MAG: 50S ribosomal protein L21 [Bacteroidales bacterium]|nr:50S ribosomal protein L21 [Bacteroidales bacterium]